MIVCDTLGRKLQYYISNNRIPIISLHELFFTENVGKLWRIERRENNIYDCLTYVKIVISTRVFIWAKYSM